MIIVSFKWNFNVFEYLIFRLKAITQNQYSDATGESPNNIIKLMVS